MAARYPEHAATATTPLPMEIDPRVAFERLFGEGGTNAERAARRQADRSILDTIMKEVAHLETALRLRPNDAGAHYNLGNVLSEMPGRTANAIAEYRAALQLKPDYAEAHLNLGSVLADLLGHLPKAIAEDRATLRVNPQLVEGH